MTIRPENLENERTLLSMFSSKATLAFRAALYFLRMLPISLLSPFSFSLYIYTG